MTTQQQNNEEKETTLTVETKDSKKWIPKVGYLFSIIFLSGTMYFGVKKAEDASAVGDDIAIFTGIFIIVTGILISVATALSIFVTSRKKKG